MLHTGTHADAHAEAQGAAVHMPGAPCNLIKPDIGALCCSAGTDRQARQAQALTKTSSSVELMYMLRSPNRAMDPDMSACKAESKEPHTYQCTCARARARAHTHSHNTRTHVEHTRLSVRIETAARATSAGTERSCTGGNICRNKGLRSQTSAGSSLLHRAEACVFKHLQAGHCCTERRLITAAQRGGVHFQNSADQSLLHSEEAFPDICRIITAAQSGVASFQKSAGSSLLHREEVCTFRQLQADDCRTGERIQLQELK
eukprot:724688-Pelagomonas_calceolata.AAC.9